MKLPPRRLVLSSGLVPTLLTAVLSLAHPSLFANLEYEAYDILVRAAATHSQSGRIVIVDVDERSLAAIGQWPWRRDTMGKLIAGIRALGSSAIALDIMFPESDRFEGLGIDTDRALADTLAGGGVVLGYALTFEQPSTHAAGCVQHPLGIAMIRRGDEHARDPFFQATG